MVNKIGKKKADRPLASIVIHGGNGPGYSFSPIQPKREVLRARGKKCGNLKKNKAERKSRALVLLGKGSEKHTALRAVRGERE